MPIVLNFEVDSSGFTGVGHLGGAPLNYVTSVGVPNVGVMVNGVEYLKNLPPYQHIVHIHMDDDILGVAQLPGPIVSGQCGP